MFLFAWKNECINIHGHTGLANNWNVMGWGSHDVVFQGRDCSWATQSSKQILYLHERCHLVRLRACSLFLCTEWEQHREWLSWFLQTTPFLTAAKDRPTPPFGEENCGLTVFLLPLVSPLDCPLSEVEVKARKDCASSDDVTLRFQLSCQEGKRQLVWNQFSPLLIQPKSLHITDC